MSLDQFYTRREVSKKCIDSMLLDKYETILEPSAGDGSFIDQLPDRTIGIDLEPKTEGIQEMNFYDWKEKVDLIIGNPPFGRVSSEAIKFFNHAAKYTNTIAFIIPRTFRKVSVQNRLDYNFYLISDIDIDKGSFIPASMQAKCCFQVWERGEPKRSKIDLPLTHEDFTFLPYSERNEADFAVRSAGSNIDKLQLDMDSLSNNWHFIKLKDLDYFETFENLLYYPLAGNTVRQDCIGKADLIYLYTEYLKRKKLT
jgi:hypothetical protein